MIWLITSITIAACILFIWGMYTIMVDEKMIDKNAGKKAWQDFKKKYIK